MKKSPEEVSRMEPEEYEAYLNTLSPQERKEEEDKQAAIDAEYQAEIDRIAASDYRKFDHAKINKMSPQEQTKFMEGLSSEDLSLYVKEILADSDKRINEMVEDWSFKTMPTLYIGMTILWIIFAGWIIWGFMPGAEPGSAGVRILILAAIIIGVLYWYLRKKKIERICRRCGFTLVKDFMLKDSLTRQLKNFSFLQKGKTGSLIKQDVRTDMGEMISLNLPGKKAYAAQVEYEWGYGKGRGSKTAQALILEAAENMPYIKISPRVNVFTGLKFFYEPALGNLEHIKIDKGHNLFCAPENAQRALDISAGVLQDIKKHKFTVEISGKWIVVIKWGYTTSFDKFVNQALPIAKVFDEKYL